MNRCVFHPHLDRTGSPRQNQGVAKPRKKNSSAKSVPAPQVVPQDQVERQQLIWIVIGIVVVLLLLGSALFQYRKSRLLAGLSATNGQQQVEKQEADQIVKSLAKLTYLPTEQPSITTVLEPQFLVNKSAFYRDLQKGDKLIVYQQAKKAFIYRPKENLVVNVGPVTPGM